MFRVLEIVLSTQIVIFLVFLLYWDFRCCFVCFFRERILCAFFVYSYFVFPWRCFVYSAYEFPCCHIANPDYQFFILLVCASLVLFC